VNRALDGFRADQDGGAAQKATHQPEDAAAHTPDGERPARRDLALAHQAFKRITMLAFVLKCLSEKRKEVGRPSAR
jgi:hypothetical protein